MLTLSGYALLASSFLLSRYPVLQLLLTLTALVIFIVSFMYYWVPVSTCHQ